MSQAWKQTKLNVGGWKKRPCPDDIHDGEQYVRLVAPSSSELSRLGLSSTTSLHQELHVDGSPSLEPATREPLKDRSESQPFAMASSVASINESLITADLPSPQIPGPKAANNSFTSSQLPTSSSSQRIVRNGERMVTNSDEDDDSSSLEDLDDLIRLKEPKPPETTVEWANKIRATASGASRRASSRGSTARKLTAVPTKPRYKYSLGVLAEQQRQLQNCEEVVAEVNALLHAQRQNYTMNKQAISMNRVPNESVIDAVISHTGDGEEVSRLKNALRRTEALCHDHAWSFFKANAEVDFEAHLEISELEDHHLRHILQNPSSHQHAFLNGYVEDHVAKKDLSDELLLWIMERTCLETREDLRLSYVHVLSELGLRNEDLLTPKVIDEFFRRIGARDEALELKKPIVPYNRTAGNAEGINLECLSSVLGLIKTLSSMFKPDSSVHAICMMCRLLLDYHVAGNCNLMTAIDETLSCLIGSIPETIQESALYKALVVVYGSVNDPALRLQLVRNLPVSDFRTAIFRRRLALAFFFEDTSYLGKPAEEPMVNLDSIAAYLQVPRFNIDKKTDYAGFTTSMAMLDVGIDAGDPLLPFAAHQDEQRFDSAVDRLSTRLKDLSSQIVGASALDMRRTEAREILAAIQRRLSYAVRYTTPLKKSILADVSAGHRSEKEAMTQYLHRTSVKNLDGPLAEATRTSINQRPIQG